MTAREPSAVEVIAEALRDRLEDLDVLCPLWERDYEAGDVPCEKHQAEIDRLMRLGLETHVLAALKAAGFVVATRDEIRAWPVSEQAELIGGEVETYRWHPGSQGVFVSTPRVRVRSPWREVQP